MNLLSVLDEPLILPPGFRNPKTGQFKQEPEAFFLDKAVRIMADCMADGNEHTVPIWLDVVRFEDRVVDGAPVRLGIGRLQRGVYNASIGYHEGDEIPFEVDEVFDVIQRFVPPEGGVWLTPVAA